MNETITAIETIALRIPLDIWAPPPMSQGIPRTHLESLYKKSALQKLMQLFAMPGNLCKAAGL